VAGCKKDVKIQVQTRFRTRQSTVTPTRVAIECIQKICDSFYQVRRSTDLIGSQILKLLLGLYCTFLTFVRDYGFNLVNHAAASPWLRRSWSPNYSVLVLILRTIHFSWVLPGETKFVTTF
jgi:hypothetical protein